MRLHWLPEALRGAGLTVHTYPGWESRGSASWGPLRGIVCHATAGSRTSTDTGETRVLWETGSTSAPVPISQLYLSRSGDWWVGATGRCNHVLTGTQGPHRGFGNASLIGVEAANDNRGEPWPAVMLDSYQRGVAAICARMGWDASRVVGHREHQSDKTDPAGIDMNEFRRRVAQLIAAPSNNMTEVDDVVMYGRTTDDATVWAGDGVHCRPVRAEAGIVGGWAAVETFPNAAALFDRLGVPVVEDELFRRLGLPVASPPPATVDGALLAAVVDALSKIGDIADTVRAAARPQ